MLPSVAVASIGGRVGKRKRGGGGGGGENAHARQANKSAAAALVDPDGANGLSLFPHDVDDAVENIAFQLDLDVVSPMPGVSAATTTTMREKKDKLRTEVERRFVNRFAVGSMLYGLMNEVSLLDQTANHDPMGLRRLPGPLFRRVFVHGVMGIPEDIENDVSAVVRIDVHAVVRFFALMAGASRQTWVNLQYMCGVHMGRRLKEALVPFWQDLVRVRQRGRTWGHADEVPDTTRLADTASVPALFLRVRRLRIRLSVPPEDLCVVCDTHAGDPTLSWRRGVFRGEEPVCDSCLHTSMEVRASLDFRRIPLCIAEASFQQMLWGKRWLHDTHSVDVLMAPLRAEAVQDVRMETLVCSARSFLVAAHNIPDDALCPRGAPTAFCPDKFSSRHVQSLGDVVRDAIDERAHQRTTAAMVNRIQVCNTVRAARRAAINEGIVRAIACTYPCPPQDAGDVERTCTNLRHQQQQQLAALAATQNASSRTTTT